MTITELEQCIDKYGKDIFSFCRRITGSIQEGEDLYQDTFLKALELSERMDMEKNPKSFLLSIAIRLWKNRRRKYAWRHRIAGMESLDAKSETNVLSDPAEERLPEEEILTREQNCFVQSCITELPEKYRIPIYLYYSAELSVKEISCCLKLPEGTVKSRLHKARTMIKERLEAFGYDK
ncbi:MAG: RNA polymerase sigma factor [Suilimivivens sp.]